MRIRRDVFVKNLERGNGTESDIVGHLLHNVSAFLEDNVSAFLEEDNTSLSGSTLEQANTTVVGLHDQPSDLLQTLARGLAQQLHISHGVGNDIQLALVPFVLLCLCVLFLGAMLFVMCCIKRGAREEYEGESPHRGPKATLSHRSALVSADKKASNGGRLRGRSEGTVHSHVRFDTDDTINSQSGGASMPVAMPPAAEGSEGEPLPLSLSVPLVVQHTDVAAGTGAPDNATKPSPPGTQSAPTGRSYRAAPPPPPAFQDSTAKQVLMPAGGHARDRQELMQGKTTPELEEKLMRRHQSFPADAGSPEDSTPVHRSRSDGTAVRSSQIGPTVFQERLEAARARERTSSVHSAPSPTSNEDGCRSAPSGVPPPSDDGFASVPASTGGSEGR